MMMAQTKMKALKGSEGQTKIKTVEHVIFTVILYIILLSLCVIMLYPMLNTLAVALNDGLDSVRGGITIFPRQFTWGNFRTVLALDTITQSFWISVSRTVINVITNIIATSMVAYAISRREYVFAKFVATAFILTMYFDAGLIPGYMNLRRLGLLNSFGVYWIPGFIGAFNLIIVRTFIKSIPEEMIESARIDGAGDFRIYWQIIMPLCKPVLATVALFVAVGQWNSWFDAMIFNGQSPHLSTLQNELQKILRASLNIAQGAQGGQAGAAAAQIGAEVTTPIAIRAAITIVSAVPILAVYPFMQRYFIAGMNVGGVKG